MPDKYQEEIEELLRGLGEKSPANGRREMETPPDDAPIMPNPPPSPTGNRSGPRPGSSLSANKVMLLGAILLIIGLVSPIWKLFLILGGLGFIFGGYSVRFFKPTPAPRQKYFRGRVIEEEPTAWDKFRRWMRK